MSIQDIIIFILGITITASAYLYKIMQPPLTILN